MTRITTTTPKAYTPVPGRLRTTHREGPTHTASLEHGEGLKDSAEEESDTETE